MAGFRGAGRGATARFAAGEAAIIRSLVSQVAELVGGGAELAETGSGDASPGDSARPGLADEAPGADRDGADRDGPAGDRAAADDLAAQLGLTDDSELPADPILARLLPDAYADDPQASGEFRRYTELSLRSGKVAAAQTVLATLPAHGGRVRLSEPEAQAWLRALNDVRLSLGVILSVTDDFEDQLAGMPEDDPRAAYVGVYQWLAALQDSLVGALS
ncbi:MAG TPA: DUF2017 domain-containing protein [Streptosporangiaceae bacterium]